MTEKEKKGKNQRGESTKGSGGGSVGRWGFCDRIGLENSASEFSKCRQRKLTEGNSGGQINTHVCNEGFKGVVIRDRL